MISVVLLLDRLSDFIDYIWGLFNSYIDFNRNIFEKASNTRVGGLIKSYSVSFASVLFGIMCYVYGIVGLSAIFFSLTIVGFIIEIYLEGEMREKAREEARMDTILLGSIMLAFIVRVPLLGLFPLVVLIISINLFFYKEVLNKEIENII